ncbi:MAG: methylmalonyl Co-A mutase-associated GTPase MeaB [Promethearchaeota archaeon]
MEFKGLIDGLLKGNTRSAARLMTLVENDIELSEKVITSIYDKTGNAYILGITGAPGSGKSTFIATLTKKFIALEKKIGIICVDPSSPLTGGALLGDRIRMKESFSVKNVFIRSMANRGQLGGLSRATEDVIKILDAYGCDIIIIETVGVGQSEVDIFHSAATVLVLLVPGLGDYIQTIKAGIMEITDIFVVNKMDLPGADRKIAEIQQMLEMNLKYHYEKNDQKEQMTKKSHWIPEILKVNSLTGENFDELMKAIEKHRDFLNQTSLISKYLENRIKNETKQIVKYKLIKKIEDLLENNNKMETYLTEVKNKSLDPYSMANKIIKLLETPNS